MTFHTLVKILLCITSVNLGVCMLSIIQDKAEMVLSDLLHFGDIWGVPHLSFIAVALGHRIGMRTAN
jgi:hypothetical protein